MQSIDETIALVDASTNQSLNRHFCVVWEASQRFELRSVKSQQVGIIPKTVHLSVGGGGTFWMVRCQSLFSQPYFRLILFPTNDLFCIILHMHPFKLTGKNFSNFFCDLNLLDPQTHRFFYLKKNYFIFFLILYWIGMWKSLSHSNSMLNDHPFSEQILKTGSHLIEIKDKIIRPVWLLVFYNTNRLGNSTLN